MAPSAGTYFVVADAAPLGFRDGLDFCRRLPELAGVVAVPIEVFCDQADLDAAWSGSRSASGPRY